MYSVRPSSTEAELRGIIRSRDHLASNVSSVLPSHICILTDPKTDSEEFNKAFCDHYTVHQIEVWSTSSLEWYYNSTGIDSDT